MYLSFSFQRTDWMLMWLWCDGGLDWIGMEEDGTAAECGER